MSSINPADSKFARLLFSAGVFLFGGGVFLMGIAITFGVAIMVLSSGLSVSSSPVQTTTAPVVYAQAPQPVEAGWTDNGNAPTVPGYSAPVIPYNGGAQPTPPTYASPSANENATYTPMPTQEISGTPFLRVPTQEHVNHPSSADSPADQDSR